ncbi:MAG: hypothetical protein QF926_06510 [Alphaproteobacteria bacterium]|jgi:hypothetical protein|nr:hypothetical protein [Alphaproteobacteria bacterium]MDP6516254.1 hypothetical protein [Alphaproteobacteria bacterium]
MIPRFGTLIVALVITAGPGVAWAGDGFVAGFEDLPLMDGLVVVDQAGIVFDTPGGRIVECYATGTVPAAAVTDFYRATLPALGWIESGPSVFRRDGENLTVSVLGAGEATVMVRFSLAPE